MTERKLIEGVTRCFLDRGGGKDRVPVLIGRGTIWIESEAPAECWEPEAVGMAMGREKEDIATAMQECEAISKLVRTCNEFGHPVDPEYQLPRLAQAVYELLYEYRTGSATRAQLKACWLAAQRWLIFHHGSSGDEAVEAMNAYAASHAGETDGPPKEPPA